MVLHTKEIMTVYGYILSYSSNKPGSSPDIFSTTTPGRWNSDIMFPGLLALLQSKKLSNKYLFDYTHLLSMLISIRLELVFASTKLRPMFLLVV